MRTLLAVAVFFSLVGCASEAPPLPDIEATVEARLELAKASLVAPTAVPLPTYTPMPLPSPEVIVKEVVVEKEVPVEVQVIKEVEVSKRVIVPGPGRVVTKEVIVEKPVEVVVEKIVEVVVIASPTPTVTPTPTATPTPNLLDYISMETSSGTTNAGLKYKDVLVRNTHPSLDIMVVGQINFVEKDSEGYILSQSRSVLHNTNYGACLKPNQTYRFRYEDRNRDNYTGTLEWQAPYSYFMPDSCLPVENIDETLIDEVEIDIQRASSYGFTVEIKNNSKHKVGWAGEFLVTDEYGNIIIHNINSTKDYLEKLNSHTFIVVANGKVTKYVEWDGWDNFVDCGYTGLCGSISANYYYIENEPAPYDRGSTTYGDFTTSLRFNDATLITRVLKKVD